MSININQCKHINSMSFKEKQSKLVQINANPRKTMQINTYRYKLLLINASSMNSY